MLDVNQELDLLDAKEAAAFLRLSTGAVHKMKQSGELKHIRLGRRVFYRRSTLMDFVINREKAIAVEANDE
jgi:excisionase family DNA binding protein